MFLDSSEARHFLTRMKDLCELHLSTVVAQDESSDLKRTCGFLNNRKKGRSVRHALVVKKKVPRNGCTNETRRAAPSV